MLGTTEKNQVVITGVGVISPLGVVLPDHVEALKKGKGGIRFEPCGEGLFPEFMGVAPAFNPRDFIASKKAIRSMNRRTLLGCTAAALASRDAGQASGGATEAAEENAILFGGGFCDGVENCREAIVPCVGEDGKIDYEMLGNSAYRNLPPLWILPLLPNTTAGHISIQHSLKGLNFSIVNGITGGFMAVGEAFWAIRDGRAKRAFCGGSEGEIYTDFCWRMKKRGVFSDTENGSKAFGRESDGWIPAEGAAVLIAESRERADSVETRAYGSVLSYSSRYLPGYQGQDSEAVAAFYERSMQQALDDAEVAARNIDFIQAGACGVPKIDYAEALAIRRLFSRDVFITSSQPATGCALAGSGPMAVAYALLQLNGGFIAPIIRTEDFFLADALNYVARGTLEHESEFCLVNCFDHLGNAASMVLKRGEL